MRAGDRTVKPRVGSGTLDGGRTPTPTTPASPRTRSAMAPRAAPKPASPSGRAVGLTRESIVVAALGAMDRDGIDAFSMRRLAVELGVTVQALYWHFDNKDALCLAVVERARNELAAVPLGRGTPIRRLERHLRALRSHWRSHPSAMALGRRYPPTAAGGFVDQGLALIHELGFAPDEARQAYRALVWAVLGFVFIEQGVKDSVHHHPLDSAGRRYEVTVDDDLVGGSAVVDTEALFDDVLRFALRGVAASAP